MRHACAECAPLSGTDYKTRSTTAARADNVRRLVIQRALEKGESPVEGGERPLYSPDIQSIIAAYACEGSPEAMLRKFMVDVAWLSGGRGGEMSNLTWEGLLVCVFECNPALPLSHLNVLVARRLIRSTKSCTRTRCKSRSLQ